jgi:hypothetical protein
MPLRTAPPPRSACEALPAGVTWDAVRVPRNIGLTALTILGARSGAVIEDPNGLALYWFIRPGRATAWGVTNTVALSTGSFVVVPPARRTAGPGPHWRVCPGTKPWTTDVEALRTAVEDALHPGHGTAAAQ